MWHIKLNTLFLRFESMRLRQLKALEAVTGAWKDKDHPELKQGAAKWVRKIRQETERRFQK